MRLLRTNTASDQRLELSEFHSRNCSPYAILSHTWSGDEVLFSDVGAETASQKKGFPKLMYSTNQARKHGLEYVWVDTCCINKNSSVELSEAINAMFSWYQNATRCYAYLEDVSVSPSSAQTLQSLGVSR